MDKFLNFIGCAIVAGVLVAVTTVAVAPGNFVTVVEPVAEETQETEVALFAQPSICRDGFSEIEWQGDWLCVMNDYYMEDGIRMPVTGVRAEQIVEETGLMYLTPAMVDAVWANADVRLSPIPTTPDGGMTTLTRFREHHAMIEDQLEGMGITDTSGLLIAGHKKDIIAPRRSGRVTIYGWHRSSGSPIQPVSSVHGAQYADYSHGLRLGYITPRGSASD